MTNKQRIILGKDDLQFFGKASSPGTFTVKSAPFHKELSRALLDKNQRLTNIIAPRAHAKTSYGANLLPLHHLIYDTKPTFIILVSKTQGHSNMNLTMIKNVLEFSEHFQALYGYWGKATAKSWNQSEIILVDPRNPKRTIMIRSFGAQQQLRGLKYINTRPRLVVYDDPEDETNTITIESRNKTLNGLLKGIVPGLAPDGRAIVIGTPIHAQGLVNVIEDMDTWRTYRYKALNLKEGIPDDAPEAQRYYALWPEIWSVPDLLKERSAAEKIGRLSSFYSEYQCEIVGDKDQLFRAEDFRYWEGEVKWDKQREAYLEITAKSDPGGTMLPVKEEVPINIFMGIDPASSTSLKADYSCIFIIGMDEKKNVYCLKYVRKRLKPMQLADRIVAEWKKFHPKKTQIESTGYQEMLRQYLKEHVDVRMPGLEIKNNPRNAKSVRLESVQPEFASGKVFMKTEMKEFEEELLLFPRGKNDDTLDGFYYARKGAYIPYHAVHEGKVDQHEHFKTIDWQTV